MFQSTHPCGVRRVSRQKRVTTRRFNPRTRVGCDYNKDNPFVELVRFNPRTRVGCDLTRGIKMAVKSFNPRTRVGCDPCFWYWRYVFGSFNPRTRVGCDFDIQLINPVAITVSIHAPVWGATIYPCVAPGKKLVSIHAPVWGATCGFHASQINQSFNPRTRVGCDPVVTFINLTLIVSIHAPVWGAT